MFPQHVKAISKRRFPGALVNNQKLVPLGVSLITVIILTQEPTQENGSGATPLATDLSRFRTPHKLNRYILAKSDNPKDFDSVYAT